MFENRVLRRIFGPKRKEVVRGWRRLHNEKIHNLYASPYMMSKAGSSHARIEKCRSFMVL
jgi:hypothetical protein